MMNRVLDGRPFHNLLHSNIKQLLGEKLWPFDRGNFHQPCTKSKIYLSGRFQIATYGHVNIEHLGFDESAHQPT